jgi:hypothetical protein
MPAYGLIPDSPFIYGGAKFVRRISRLARRGGVSLLPARVVVTYKFKKLVIYKPILNFELNSRYGMVDRHLHGVANRIAQLARLQAGYRTGLLKANIRISHQPPKPTGPSVKVGAYVRHALIHHEGTKPHVITPNKPGGSLVFMKGSRIVRTKIVMHPGTRPNRYLTDQLRKVIF